MKCLFIRLLVVTIGVSLMFLAGCAGTEHARFYTLHSVPDIDIESQGATIDNGVAVGIGPVRIPMYLDRPQIVTSKGQNEIHLAEFDRWAEPLKHNVTRVLAENLSIQLSTNRIAVFPWKRSTEIDYRVAVEIIRFDVTADGESLLIARWTLSRGEEREVLLSRKSIIGKSVGAKDYKAIVSAMSGNLTDLSSEIAQAIKADLQKTHEQ